VATPAESLVADLLGKEGGELRRFVDLLQREQSLLTQGNLEPLLSLAEEKSAAAERLGQLSAKREETLAAEGCVGNMGGWLAKPGHQTLADAWQNVLDLAGKAKHLNETNGQLIALRFQHNQQALATLLAAADQAVTYGPDGQQRAPGGGRTLGSA
jgi:flagella synthesis protein FlgN